MTLNLPVVTEEAKQARRLNDPPYGFAPAEGFRLNVTYRKIWRSILMSRKPNLLGEQVPHARNPSALILVPMGTHVCKF